MNTAQLLTAPTNYAVVQLPERQFTGLVFQGDSLASLIGELEEAVAISDPSEQADAIKGIVAQLHAVRSRYEAVLNEAGIPFPY